jgi:hypothetical protein
MVGVPLHGQAGGPENLGEALSEITIREMYSQAARS